MGLIHGVCLNDRLTRQIVDKYIVIDYNKIYVYEDAKIIYTIYGHSDYYLEGFVENVSLEWVDEPTSWCFCILCCSRTVRLHRMKLKLKNYATITMYSVEGWNIINGLG